MWFLVNMNIYEFVLLEPALCMQRTWTGQIEDAHRYTNGTQLPTGYSREALGKIDKIDFP